MINRFENKKNDNAKYHDDKENSPNFKNSEPKVEDRIKPYKVVEKNTIASKETLSTNRTKLEN